MHVVFQSLVLIDLEILVAVFLYLISKELSNSFQP